MDDITRRKALGVTFMALGAFSLAGTAAALGRAAGSSSARASGAVDEMYMGRRIQIASALRGSHHGEGHAGLPTVQIDGATLHVMHNADGTWISVVNHYETFSDPLSLARAAVRELRGAALTPMPMGGAA
ncbi:tyrosinase family oxidase copper chaperone [Streptomyces sp. 2231.1]|uniref:apotyrosinase chaperone MelC1 n=1 Tax=Streptomyces sp. 2231.1 TaxID=1855347 RepID=UPI000B8667E1|nr:tyrosinase family oxidase copper chaperone [Streptomyces sp. 2231.1]